MRTIHNIRYSDLGHERQVLDLHLPDRESFPVFIYFHGGGIEGGDKAETLYQPMIRDLVEAGVAVAMSNYRLYPSARFPEFIQDAAAAVAWVKAHIHEYGEATAIYVGGSSAGGYLTQMLCFDRRYLDACGVDADGIDGYFMDAGQPTVHFNVLRERGLDSRRALVDEAAPLYFIDGTRTYPPMKILVSDHDMDCRPEQTALLVATMRHLGCDMSRVDYEIVPDSGHCAYLGKLDENGKSVFARMILNYIGGLR